MSASTMTAISPSFGRRAILADAGPLFAVIDDRDHYHARARRESDRLLVERRSLVLLNPTLGEIHTLILRHYGPEAAHSWLADIGSAVTLVAPSDEQYVAAMDRVALYRDQPITVFDALLAAMSGELGLPVWTYDHHFDVMGITVWRWRKPIGRAAAPAPAARLRLADRAFAVSPPMGGWSRRGRLTKRRALLGVLASVANPP